MLLTKRTLCPNTSSSESEGMRVHDLNCISLIYLAGNIFADPSEIFFFLMVTRMTSIFFFLSDIDLFLDAG